MGVARRFRSPRGGSSAPRRGSKLGADGASEGASEPAASLREAGRGVSRWTRLQRAATRMRCRGSAAPLNVAVHEADFGCSCAATKWRGITVKVAPAAATACRCEILFMP